MTTLAQPVTTMKPFGFLWGTPPGASDDADLIVKKYQDLFYCFVQSATDSQGLADPLHSLQQIVVRCRTPNWDGEGAPAISGAAVPEAQLLLWTLSHKFPLPEIFPEATGAIALEWYRGPGYRLVATVSGNRTIEFAGLFGPGNEIYGEFRIQAGIPRQMRDLLNDLFA